MQLISIVWFTNLCTGNVSRYNADWKSIEIYFGDVF